MDSAFYTGLWLWAAKYRLLYPRFSGHNYGEGATWIKASAAEKVFAWNDTTI